MNCAVFGKGVMRLLKRKSPSHYLTYLGLFAVLMLTIGPVISQIQAMLMAAPHSITMNSHKDMAHSYPNNLTSSNTTTNQTTTKTDQPKTHHNMSLCGYCDLLHTPVLITYILLITQTSLFKQPVKPQYIADIYSSSYINPLSRAPPSAIAILTTT